MRKIVYLILLLSLLWLAKLSYDVAQYSQIVPQLQQQLLQAEQRSRLLNDQFVAFQRELQHPSTLQSPEKINVSDPKDLVDIAPTTLIRQQLQLVQFALDQQQFSYALEHLNQLQQQITHYTLPPALQQSLVQSIEKDEQAIQHYVVTQQQQQQQLDTLLQQLDRQIQQNIQNPALIQTKSEKSEWWHWFKLEKVQRSSPDLIHRNLTLKEVQLRLLLASQALHHGQFAEYHQTIEDIAHVLAELPDPNSQQIKLRLEKISNLTVLPIPKLTTLGLLG